MTIGANTALQFATVNLAPGAATTDQVAFASGVTAATFGGLSGNALGGMKLQTGSTAVALTVNQSATTSFGGVLSGAGAFSKAGSGALTLTNANTHTGGTTVSGGTLALDFSASGAPTSNILADSGAVTLSGGTLRIIGKAGQDGVVQTFAGLTSGSAPSTLELVQNGATSLDVNVGALTFGAGTLNFAGLTGTTAGARVITSTNAGGNDATTQLSATSALWNGTDWASVAQVSGTKYLVQWTGAYTNITTNGNTTNPSGDLKIQNGTASGTAVGLNANSTVNSLLMTATTYPTTLALGGNTLTVGASGSGNIAIGTSGKSLTIGTGVVGDTLTYGTTGAATLNLSNANAASTLTVNAAIADNAGAGAVSVVLTGGPVVFNGNNSYSGTTTLAGGADLGFDNFAKLGTAGVAASNLVLSGGALRYTGATATTTRGMTFNNAGSILDLAAGTTLTVSGQLAGAGSWTKSGDGELTLSGTNTNTGSITVAGGILKAASTTAFSGDGTAAGRPALILANTAGVGFALNNNATTIGSLAGGGASGGNVALGTATLTTGGNGTATTYAGVISGSGGLTQTGGGRLTLSGANNYSGQTTISGAALSVIDGGSLGTGQVNLRWGGTLTYNRSTDTTVTNVLSVYGGGESTASRGLRSDGAGALIWTGNTLAAGANSSLTRTFFLGGTGTAANTFAGSIHGNAGTGSIDFEKRDSGTWRLSAANAWDGNATILAGKLITAHTSALSTGNVSVASGGILQLGDSGANSGVTLGSGATLALAADATLRLGATNSRITMTGGNFTLSDGFNLDITGIGIAAGQYTLVTGSGAGSTLGAWSSSTDLFGGNLSNFSYALAKSGNNLVFSVTAVPEPSTYGLLGAGALAAAALARRRRRAR